MPSIDVFKGDGFSMTELTASINRAPYQPGRLGAMGLFESDGIRTTTFQLERKGRMISLLPSKPRGAAGTQKEKSKRKLRTFNVPHIPYDGEILADDIQDIRSFPTPDGGGESELEAASDILNDQLDEMRQDHEVTHEFLRIGAIKGSVIDGDGTTVLIDLFSEFGISQTAVDFVLGTGTTDIKGKAESVRRAIEDALGAFTYTGIHAFCGNSFWDKLVAHAKVEAAYDRWQDGAFLRTTQRDIPGQQGGFEFGGIIWENYRGKIGDVPFIPDADCRFVPMGVRGLLLERYAPADIMDAVNTKGLPVYALQEPKRFGKGIDIHTQSNPLMICSIPEVLVRGHTSN